MRRSICETWNKKEQEGMGWGRCVGAQFYDIYVCVYVQVLVMVVGT